MKNTLILFLLFTGISNAQVINFPDANLKAKLLSSDPSNFVATDMSGIFFKIDTNNDGDIQVSEAQAVKWLNIGNANIASLAGIENFINLESLDCTVNQLTSLNVSMLVNLQTLACDNNQLTSLNTTGLANLHWLGCKYNQLTTLNLNGLTHLYDLWCDGNQLSSLDVSGVPTLQYLYCAQNQITSLDVSGLPNLYNFRCYENQLTSMDVSNCPILSIFSCHTNNLTFLNIKNGSIEDAANLDFHGNPNLQYICADEGQLQMVQDRLNLYGMTSNVGSYCSFTPGGNYNTITGNITFDANNNGCDVNDVLQPNIRINISGGTGQGATFSNSSGNYNFYTQGGSFDVNPSVENPSWFTISPATATIVFADNNNNTTTQNFCIAPNGFHTDLEVVISPVIPARPGFDAVYKIVYRNKGNVTPGFNSGVNLSYNPDQMSYVSSSQPIGTQGNDYINFDYANLLPFESRSIVVTFHINAPTGINPVNNGDILSFIAQVGLNIGDENFADNTFTYNQEVVGSYDPNDITCLEGETVAPAEIGNYLHYIVNFENTGSYQADNIVVTDDIDITKYDINSLQLLHTSHAAYTRINGNKVEFIFEGINLAAAAGNPPVGGHGNVLFKIKSKSDLAPNDFVTKTAQIFFDYNAPITTNDAQTTFQLLSNSIFELDAGVVVYPNPTHSLINIKSDSNIKSVELYDIQGRVLQSNLFSSTDAGIDLSARQNGVYFLKITSEKGSKVEKIVKK